MGLIGTNRERRVSRDNSTPLLLRALRRLSAVPVRGCASLCVAQRVVVHGAEGNGAGPTAPLAAGN